MPNCKHVQKLMECFQKRAKFFFLTISVFCVHHNIINFGLLSHTVLAPSNRGSINSQNCFFGQSFEKKAAGRGNDTYVYRKVWIPMAMLQVACKVCAQKNSV